MSKQSPTEERARQVQQDIDRVQRRVGEWDRLQGHEPRDRFAAFSENLRHDAMTLATSAAALASQAAQPAEADGVERLREAAQGLLDACNLRALRGRDHVPSMRAEQDARRALENALAATPKAPATDAGEVAALLEELATYLPSIRVFLTSKERPHEAGVKWHDEIVAKINAAREARHV